MAAWRNNKQRRKRNGMKSGENVWRREIKEKNIVALITLIAALKRNNIVAATRALTNNNARAKNVKAL